MMGPRVSSYIECAIDYAEAGFWQKALAVLNLCPAESPMLWYYRAFYSDRSLRCRWHQ